MVRFGLNSFLLSSGFNNGDLPLVAQFKEWGADIIELAVHEPGKLAVAPVRGALDEASIGIGPVCGMFPPDRDLRGSAAQQQHALNYVCALIDLASELGATMVAGPMYSCVGRCNLHPQAEKEEQLDVIARNLETLCKKAEQVGIRLGIEPLNRFETDCINTLAQAAALIEKVGRPSLKIHLDTFHMHIEESNSAQAVREAGPYIGHVHASASHRGIPGRDQVDWNGIFKALQDVEYAGDIVIETFSTDNDTIARAASIWMQRFDTPEQLAREGLAFLRNTWTRVSGPEAANQA